MSTLWALAYSFPLDVLSIYVTNTALKINCKQSSCSSSTVGYDCFFFLGEQREEWGVHSPVLSIFLLLCSACFGHLLPPVSAEPSCPGLLAEGSLSPHQWSQSELLLQALLPPAGCCSFCSDVLSLGWRTYNSSPKAAPFWKWREKSH